MHDGHQQVEHYHFRTRFLQELDGFGTVSGAHDTEPTLLQHVGYDFANGLFVLYDEDKPIIRVHHRESYGKPLSILRRDPPTIVAGSASVAYSLSDEW